MPQIGAEENCTHEFTINGSPFLVKILRGENVIVRVKEELELGYLLGYITEEQYKKLLVCVAPNSFNVTAMLHVPGVSAHKRLPY